MSVRYMDKPFEERFRLMGDEAEATFQHWATQNNIITEVYGMRRPAFTAFKSLPPEIRHTPDFLCEQQGSPPRLPHLKSPTNRFARHFYAETKGVGRDQIIKIKPAEFEVMKKWQEFGQRPVVVFVCDSHRKRISHTLTLNVLEALSLEVEVGHFYDGGPPKPYWKIPVDALEWEDSLVDTQQESNEKGLTLN